ncbi:MAG: hypothetical protein ACRCXD_06755, partial [Luteolibacter sp.]
SSEQEVASFHIPLSPLRPASGAQASGHESFPRTSRAQGRREAAPAIKTDSNGNLILPVSLVDRFQILVLSGLEANREDLRVMGMSDSQIHQVQQIVDQTLQRCFDREKSVVQDFTMSDDELVRMIPGNPSAAATEKQRLVDAIQLMGGTETALLEKELVGKLAGLTLDFGAMDSFFRVSRKEGSGNSERLLFFERLQLSPRPGESPPSPGTSFIGYTEKYEFSSTSRFVAKAPPDETAHLLQDGQWKPLLQPKRRE